MTELNVSVVNGDRPASKAVHEDLRQKDSRLMPCVSLVKAIALQNTDLRKGTGERAPVHAEKIVCIGEAIADHDDRSLPALSGRGQRVLVVDDQRPLLELTTDALRELGYQPVGFASAIDALRAFQADPGTFDALVTDHRMPGMSGDKLISEVRRICPSLPVILVSGYIDDGAASRSATCWADDILAKPLRARALATSLARLLAGAPGGRTLCSEISPDSSA